MRFSKGRRLGGVLAAQGQTRERRRFGNVACQHGHPGPPQKCPRPGFGVNPGRACVCFKHGCGEETEALSAFSGRLSLDFREIGSKTSLDFREISSRSSEIYLYSKRLSCGIWSITSRRQMRCFLSAGAPKKHAGLGGPAVKKRARAGRLRCSGGLRRRWCSRRGRCGWRLRAWCACPARGPSRG